MAVRNARTPPLARALLPLLLLVQACQTAACVPGLFSGDKADALTSEGNLLNPIWARALARHKVCRRAGPVLVAKAWVAIHVIAEKTILWLLLSNALVSLGCVAHFFEH